MMCTDHWRAYVKGLREARKAAAASGPEVDAA
jgi:IS1 family transposase